MIPPSDNTGGIRSSNNIRSFPNMIGFQLGKRKKELLASEADEYIMSNGDKARIAGIITPTRRKNTKLLKKNPGECLEPNVNLQFKSTNSQVLESKDEIQLKSSEKRVSEKTIHIVGSLGLLLDAIQLIEYQRLQKPVGIQAQKNDLIPALTENINAQGDNSTSRPSLQRDKIWAGAEAGKELPLGRQHRDAHYNPKGISKCVDIDADGGAMPRTRSKEGWLPTLPSKYSESVLQPWKKVTRKVPKC